MSNKRIIDGKSTPERVKDELERLRKAPKEEQARITMPAIARRVGISRDTFTHTYKEAALEAGALRDSASPTKLRRSPVTRTRAERNASTLEEARAVIKARDAEIDRLQRARSEEAARCQRAVAKVDSLLHYEDDVLYLRGIIVELQQQIFRRLPSDQASKILHESQEAVDSLATHSATA